MTLILPLAVEHIDGLALARVAGGVRAIVPSVGGRRDAEVIDACNQHGIAMILTGHRHFRHGTHQGAPA